MSHPQETSKMNYACPNCYHVHLTSSGECRYGLGYGAQCYCTAVQEILIVQQTSRELAERCLHTISFHRYNWAEEDVRKITAIIDAYVRVREARIIELIEQWRKQAQ